MSQSKANGQFRSMREPAVQAMKSAFAKLVLRKRKTGGSLVIWRDGKVCHVPATEIRIPSDEATAPPQDPT